jgi:hypothetical protein
MECCEIIYKKRMSEIGIESDLFDDIAEETETVENIERIGKRIM